MDVIQDRKSDSSGSSVVNYVNGLGIDDKLKQTVGTTTSYFLTDHLGSTVGLVDQAGSVTSQTAYDSFGNATSSLPTRYGYTGRELDEYTGLYYYRARFYDSQIGRFISEDPIGFEGGLNWYAYVENNPINLIDPEGYKPTLWQCLLRCAADQFGITTVLGITGVAAGAPIIEKPKNYKGASPRTSIASKFLSDKFPQKFSKARPAPTFVHPFAKTKVVGRFIGRWIPIVGWGLLIYDAISIAFCVNNCLNGDCNKEDPNTGQINEKMAPAYFRVEDKNLLPDFFWFKDNSSSLP
jgi:RHS repeat-associated protein